MQNLKFRQLLLLSDTNKQASRFEFSLGRNLITANDNSVGKSTLVKLLLWGMGCEPTLDNKWKSQDCRVIIQFSIGEELYYIHRYKDFIFIKNKEEETSTSFPKITGEYSQLLANLLNFKALLPSRKDKKLETPPPAYYFLPFYIDQIKSWSTAWDNFDNLAQYDKWKPTIVKYHVGLLTPDYFDLQLRQMERKDDLDCVEKQIERIEVALDVVNSYVPTITLATTDEDKFQELTDEIRLRLSDLQTNQEKLLNNFAQLQAEKSYLEQQKEISEKIILELDKDYKYSVENISDNEIECPLCGTIHENSIINRSSILVDKTQAENQLTTINQDLEKINNKIYNTRLELKRMRDSISEINKKYILEEKDNIITLNEIIENIAANSIKETASEDKNEKIIAKVGINRELNNIKKDLKNFIKKEYSDKVNNSFLFLFSDYIQKFGADSVNISDIKSPLDYNKIIKEGGAAEKTRAILAYYLAIYTMVTKFGSEVVSPLIIDTPRQQEQSDLNYEKIVSFLTNDMPKESQIFLCAMDNEALEPYKENAKIFFLDDSKLFYKNEYEEIKDIFMNF